MSSRVPLVILMLWVQLLHAQRPITAKIRISVQDEQGNVLPSPRINLVALRSKQDFGLLFKQGTISGVPFGDYDLEIFVPGFREYRRRMDVFDRDFAIRATMQISTESTGALIVHGVVAPLPKSEKETWVVLVPLAGSPADVLETTVKQGGEFSLPTLGGPFLVMVLRGSDVLYSHQIYAGHNAPPLNIVLSEKQ